MKGLEKSRAEEDELPADGGSTPLLEMVPDLEKSRVAKSINILQISR